METPLCDTIVFNASLTQIRWTIFITEIIMSQLLVLNKYKKDHVPSPSHLSILLRARTNTWNTFQQLGNSNACLRRHLGFITVYVCNTVITLWALKFFSYIFNCDSFVSVILNMRLYRCKQRPQIVIMCTEVNTRYLKAKQSTFCALVEYLKLKLTHKIY